MKYESQALLNHLNCQLINYNTETKPIKKKTNKKNHLLLKRREEKRQDRKKGGQVVLLVSKPNSILGREVQENVLSLLKLTEAFLPHPIQKGNKIGQLFLPQTGAPQLEAASVVRFLSARKCTNTSLLPLFCSYLICAVCSAAFAVKQFIFSLPLPLQEEAKIAGLRHKI